MTVEVRVESHEERADRAERNQNEVQDGDKGGRHCQ